MLVAFLFCAHDRELAFKNLQWSAEIGVGSGHKILVVCPSGVSASDAQKALSLAQEAFDEATLYHLTDDCSTGWPFGPNFMFRRTVDYVAHYNLWPILLQESDAWFLTGDGLDRIQAEWDAAHAAGKRFMGYKEFEGQTDREHMNGVGVWDDVNRYAPKALDVPWPQEPGEVRENRMAFDMAGREDILPLLKVSRLFQFQYKQEEKLLKDTSLSFLNPDAVIFHTEKTGKLVELLRKKRAHVVLKENLQDAGFDPLAEIKRKNGWENPVMLHEGLQTDIFIKTYSKVADWHQWAMKSIAKYASGFRRTLVVGEQRVEGYQQMQIVKLSADQHTDADFILFTDSDCLFTLPVTPATYLRNGKPIWLMRSWESALSKEGDAVMRWQRGMQKFFGMAPPHEFMCRHPEMIPRWLLIAFRAFCQTKHGKTLAEWLVNDHEFADWNILGMYAWLYHRECFCWINQDTEIPPVLTVKQYWGGHTPIEPHIHEMQAILNGGVAVVHVPNEQARTVPPVVAKAIVNELAAAEASEAKPRMVGTILPEVSEGWDRIEGDPSARMSLADTMIKKLTAAEQKQQEMNERMAKVRAARKAKAQ